MKLEPAVVKHLGLDPDKTTVSSAGGGGCSSASTCKIQTTLPDGSTKSYFMKTGTGSAAAVMFEGEHTSLSALSTAVPSLCPRSYGSLSSGNTSFLITDFLTLTSRSSSSGPSLASKLATLHSTPAPIPSGHESAQFGFPTTTCCGDTPQSNPYTPSWAEFYSEHRLLSILSAAERDQSVDKRLRELVHATAGPVVHALLRDGHLGGSRGITPVVVHGDLWSGNTSVGLLPGMNTPEAVVYDPSSVYAHSEYELGIMKMFGGFGAKFLQEYHAKIPKTEPVEEYEDRIALYEVYHHLNHFAMFGGGYGRSACGIMERLVGKYGGQ